MCFAGIGPVSALVGEVAKLLAPEGLELDEVLRLLLSIIGVRLSFGRVFFIILRKDDVAGRRT